VVRPARNGSSRESLKGKHSITVYNLNRLELVKRREDHARRVSHQVEHLEKAAQALEAAPQNLKRQGAFRTEVRELAESFLAEDKEFLGMARQLVFLRTRKLARRGRLKPFMQELAAVLPPAGWRR
jgi:hypothetical protein